MRRKERVKKQKRAVQEMAREKGKRDKTYEAAVMTRILAVASSKAR